MKHSFILCSVLVIGFQLSFAAAGGYKDPQTPVEQRIDDLISKMTLEEKIDMIGGTGFGTKPNARLGIPELKMTDGPVGVRWGTSTAFPAAVMLASTWDTSLAGRYGWAISQEVKAKDRNVILGPCININRVPQGGRNFENYGEDPFLTSRIAVSYVRGVQSGNVAATVKHYATNNQEWERDRINNKVGQRALYEIYLPGFKAAVEEGGAMAIMSAYNKLNGSFCSENTFLLQDVLKKEWQFQGLVMSDWGAVHSTLATANNGLDLEMPTGQFLNKETLLPLIKNGAVSESTIDDKVRRILRVMFRLGLFDQAASEKPQADGLPQRSIALDVSRAGIVLLKNENGTLPLRMSALKSVAVIGPNAAVARTGGGGSSMVNPAPAESPLDALKRMFGKTVSFNYAIGAPLPGAITPIDPDLLSPPNEPEKKGLLGEYFTNEELRGEPSVRRIDTTVNFDWGERSPAAGIGADSFSVRWTGNIRSTESGTFEFSVSTDDGVRFYINNQLLIDNWTQHAEEARSVNYAMEAGKSYDIKMEYYQNLGGAVARLGLAKPSEDKLPGVVALAQKSDAVLLFVGDSPMQESEGFDRPTIDLPASQVNLINAVVKANPHTIVVLEAGAQVVMENWIDNVNALVEAWYPGQEGAQAIAEVLSGAINPSGKLPVTMPKRWEDCSAYGSYPGANDETEYNDGILVGYRHFDAKNIDVRYPFGYGLSYAKFSISDVKVTPVPQSTDNEYTVTASVENTGDVAGAEVVQVYVHDDSAKVLRPVKELKAFAKVFLQPKEKKNVELHLNTLSFAYYDDVKHEWATSKGAYEILVGTSSRDLPVEEAIRLK
ncbi:MAG: glycoside hydrolase family 3 C-terminal domain-containing protein [Bacteroidota bacterium]